MEVAAATEVAADVPSQSVEEGVPTSKAGLVFRWLLYAALTAFMVWLFIQEPRKVGSTVVRVVLAVGLSAAVFIGANMLFDQTQKQWRRFSAIVGVLVGALLIALLEGNRLLADLGLGHGWGGSRLVWIVIGAGGLGALLWVLSGIENPRERMIVSVGGSAALGVIIGLGIADSAKPAIDWVAAIVSTLVIGAVLAGLGYLRHREQGALRWGVGGAALGWLIGAWGFADIGDGTTAEAVVATGVLALLVGVRLGMTQVLTDTQRGAVSISARKWVFLAPAGLFIIVGLVIPLIRTIYLSLYDERTVEFVGLDNFQEIFTNDSSFDLSGWADFFTSQLFYIGMVIIAAGVAVGLIGGARRRSRFEASGGSLPSIAFGLFILSFALFSVLRGTIFNNIWWVVTVTVLASGFGLAIAVLADRAKMENVAKSLIFMPMAISFVGAGIIWRFVYLARESSKPQTGVMNSLWVWLGQLSTGTGSSKAWTVFFIGVLLAIIAGLIWMSVSGFRANSAGLGWGAAVATVPLLVVLFLFIGPGMGGRTTNSAGETIPETILFLQEAPFNNVWLMVVLIWIQTGFAMVIFSAAIKAVPSELIEAAKVDGATESQVFWSVTVPQIAPTIGVVVTTLIVVVMKVFDIVKVMTNGNFGTQVVANEMWQRAFTELNFGLGSALAVVLFLSVLPIMYYNIRRMQEATV